MRNRLKVLREAEGLSQQEMAKVLGITRQTVISIENNHFDPRLSLAFRVAEHFNVPVDEVFYSADDNE
ncbi:helix-turn-helix transcriptional regulator [Ornithinimicrobium sp. Arc0846-15]|nr:helix-turn-helix transcriptional regulator [Ornithinimicrobium laminariae]